MVEFLLIVLIGVAMGYLSHEAVRIGNGKIPELNMSPNFAACIGFLFGLTGIIVLVIYGAIKVMIKRIIKH